MFKSFTSLLRRFRHWLWWRLWRWGKPLLHSLRHEYEKAGIRIGEEPVPWNADDIFVHAQISLPPFVDWCKSDFELRAPGWRSQTAISVEKKQEDDLFDVCFRCPSLQGPVLAVLLCQGTRLGRIRLPFLSADNFLSGLRIDAATVVASLRDSEIPCQSLADGQSHHMIATGILCSPTSLLPLIGFEIVAEVEDNDGQAERVIRPRLSAGQLQSKQASLCMTIGQSNRFRGGLRVNWRVGNRILARCSMRNVSRSMFQESIYLVESRYVYQDDPQSMNKESHRATAPENAFPRPCFVLASKEPGLAGVCPLELRVNFRDQARRPMAVLETMVITQTPALFSPKVPVRCGEIRSFELFCAGRMLGVVRVSPAPSASFNREGGFKATEDYLWNAWAEEEVANRLQMLMETDNDHSPAVGEMATVPLRS
jgi:hypothetical protein